MTTNSSSPSPPPHSDQLIVSFPAEHVMLLTLNRPKSLNAMSPQMAKDLQVVLGWFNEEPSLWVVIVTGAGRAFCAGMDLIAWNKDQQSGQKNEQTRVMPHGFGSLSRREITKPIIAAVNGGAYGGGTEIVLNCDLVVAGEDAKFGLPEVKRGVYAGAGGIPRLAHIAGHQLASEMLLLGNPISAKDAYSRFGFVNRVVPASDVVSTAVDLAKDICANSPDSVQTTKLGLLFAQKYDHDRAYRETVWAPETTRLYHGENIKVHLFPSLVRSAQKSY
ncbi:enoyl-hydratase [Moniliophthora roreri]|nr:enoyl-hydratase [Moniliophthora roreri]